MRQRLTSSAVLAAAVAVLVLLEPLRGVPDGDVIGWAVAAPEQGIALVAGCAAWAFALWLSVVLGLGLLAQMLAPGSRRATGVTRAIRSLVPHGMRPLLRPVLGAALGAAIVLGPTTSALAAGPAVGASGAVPGVTFVPSAVPPPLVAPPAPPLPPLDWVTPPTPAPAAPAPSSATPPTASAPAAPTPARGRLHEVVSGDTLWGVAAGQLPPDASAAAITEAWQRIYAANRTVVGPDPSFLLPGEVLVIGELS